MTELLPDDCAPATTTPGTEMAYTLRSSERTSCMSAPRSSPARAGSLVSQLNAHTTASTSPAPSSTAARLLPAVLGVLLGWLASAGACVGVVAKRSPPSHRRALPLPTTLRTQRAAAPRAAPSAAHLPRLRPLLSRATAPSRACAVFASRPPPHGLHGALRCCVPPAAEPPPARRRALVSSPRCAARPASSWRVRAVEVRHPPWNPKPHASCTLPQTSDGASEPPRDAFATAWVKRMDTAGARYADVKAADQTVSDFIARWATQAKMNVDVSLITLRLVKCGAGAPTAAEEAEAKELDDPSLTLGEAGASGTAWLLAFVAGACVQPHCARTPLTAFLRRHAAARRCARRCALSLLLCCAAPCALT